MSAAATAATQAPTASSGSLGVDQRQRVGHQRRGLAGRRRRRCGSTPRSTPPRPDAGRRARSPWRDRGSPAPASRARRRARRAPPRGAARRPAPGQASARRRATGRTAAADAPPRCRARSADASNARATSLVRAGGGGAEVPRTSVGVEHRHRAPRRARRGRGADRPGRPSSRRQSGRAGGGTRPSGANVTSPLASAFATASSHDSSPMRVRGAAQERRIAQPLGRTPTAAPSARSRPVLAPAPRTGRRGARRSATGPAAEPRRGAARPSTPRAARRAPAGCRPVAATMWSATTSSTGPPARAVSSSWASGADSPSSVDPAEAFEAPGASGVSRMVRSEATRSAWRRRPTNDNAIADSSSTHCASSMTTSTGCARAASSTRLRTARPTRNGSSASCCHVAEHGVERDSLRFGERVDAVEEREHELVHAGVPEGHLRLDADDADDTEVGCDVDRVVDQRRLADARRAGEQKRTGGATLGVTEERVDDGPFGGAADEELPSSDPDLTRRHRALLPSRHPTVTAASVGPNVVGRRPDPQDVFGAPTRDTDPQRQRLDSNTSGGSITTLSPSIPSATAPPSRHGTSPSSTPSSPRGRRSGHGDRPPAHLRRVASRALSRPRVDHVRVVRHQRRARHCRACTAIPAR